MAVVIEGVLRHDTDMDVQKSYTDSHGQSEVGFAFCHLLGFDLLPRLKAVASQKLYLPEADSSGNYPNLTEILTRPIKWDLIRQQYDEMVKYATAFFPVCIWSGALKANETDSAPWRSTDMRVSQPAVKTSPCRVRGGLSRESERPGG